MEVSFENPRHEKLVSDLSKLKKKYKGNGINILKRLKDLQDAPNPMELPPSCNFHALKGNMNGLFAVDINPSGKRGKERMIFRPCNEYATDMRKIEIISICELCKDYH